MNHFLHIRSITISPLRAPLVTPFRVATGAHRTLDNLLIKLTFSDGTTGYGEAAPAVHITSETVAETQSNFKACASSLKKYSIADGTAVTQEIQKRYPKNACLRAGLEMAWLDALTKHLNIPFWKFFGTHQQNLVSDITIVIGSLEETEQQALRFYHQGFRAFKIKIGKDFDLDLERVLAVDRITKSSRIFLDANQGFDADETLLFLKFLKKKKISVEMIEQPVKREDFEGLIKVTRESDAAVCADESARSLADVVKIIKHKAADVINIKTMKTGFAESREIACAAKAAGLKLMIGGMMESSLSMTASAHLAAGLGGFDYVDLDTPFFIQDDAQKNPFLSSKGIYTLSRSQPGIGIC